MSMADYGATTQGGLVAPHEQFQVDPLDYPVFAVKRDRVAPRSNVNYPINDGVVMPAMKKSYRWQVTHKVRGEYLIGSAAYDRDDCRSTSEYKQTPEHCSSEGIGPEYLDRIYIRPNGVGYAWVYLKNTPRWPKWFGKGDTWFRHDDTGDWLDPPRFECVARCDKRSNMKADASVDSVRESNFRSNRDRVE